MDGDREADPWRAVMRAYAEMDEAWVAVTEAAQRAPAPLSDHHRAVAAWRGARRRWHAALQDWQQDQP
jgi:hypothetical protein